MGEGDLVRALTEHGFSLNESRAYAALLAAGPSTGYEVGQKAQIPRSAVYGALRRLVQTGAARSIAGHPERFVAAPAESLMALLRDRFDASVQRLEGAVRSLDAEPPVPDAFSVHGYDRVLEEARRLIREARERLVISGWPRELEALSDALDEAARASVTSWIFSHSEIPATIAGVHFSYGLAEGAVEQFWKHRLVIVADDARTMIAATEASETDNAVISETAAIAEIATSQIALDITLLAQRYGFDTREVMAQILGERVGRLDELLAAGPRPTLGRHVASGRERAAR